MCCWHKIKVEDKKSTGATASHRIKVEDQNPNGATSKFYHHEQIHKGISFSLDLIMELLLSTP